MYGKIKDDLQQTLEELKEQGLYKAERIITSPQGAQISVFAGQTVLNFCANNYLGLASHPEVVKAAQEVMDKWGFGLSSVRFICGTQQIHKELEQKTSEFLGTEDTILYCAAFDAWSGNFVGKYWDEKQKGQIAEWLFSRQYDESGNPSGIGLSMWRVNLGAGTLEQDSADIMPFQRRAESFLTKDGKS